MVLAVFVAKLHHTLHFFCPMYLFIWFVVTAYNRPCGFYTIEIYFSQFWRLEVQSQGASMVGWRRKWQPTPRFLHEKFCGHSSLAGYSPWGCKESDMMQQLNSSNIAWLGSDEDPLPGCRLPASPRHMAERGRKTSGVPFTRALIPFTGSSPSWPNHCPKPYILISSH